jgi:hypothetical protein
MKMKKWLVVLSVFLFSCGNKNEIPSGILKPAKMQLVLWDVLRADNFVFEFVTRDTSKKLQTELAKLQQQIFAVHKISKEEFYKSFDFYKSHPDIMQPVLDSIINIATRNKYQNTRGKFNSLKDSSKVK